VVALVVVTSCGPSKKGLFTDKRTEHQKYGDQIREAGLDKTLMGIKWFSAAEKSLRSPLNITLPYKETAYFADDEPTSSGYIFNARRGDRLLVTINVVPDTLRQFFGELWKPGGSSGTADHVASIDSTRKIIHDVEEDGSYIVRLQSALLEAAEYTVTISAGPSLAFPVSEVGNPRLISFWSDPRDGGARSHEGVDISAKFRTPAIASADGIVNRVMENRLGGKVVFMRPHGKNYSLYYAHLDSQIVTTGQEVKTGQILGLVGNTGNARGTPPHLHFGIYTFGGAVDPLPFVDPRRKEPPAIASPIARIGSWLRTTTNVTLTGASKAIGDTSLQLKRGSAFIVTGATDKSYKVRMPDGIEGFIDAKNVTDAKLQTYSAEVEGRLLNEPNVAAAAIKVLEKDTKLEVLGTFGEYNLVRSGDVVGWKAGTAAR
jgi:murein DD-endopeptidase MepM/ murein hydrolase activator NlpD